MLSVNDDRLRQRARAICIERWHGAPVVVLTDDATARDWVQGQATGAQGDG